MLEIVGKRHEDEAFVEGLLRVAAVLELWKCYRVDDRYHFSLGGGYSIALSSEFGRRIRIEICHLAAARASMWSLVDNLDRLAVVVARMSEEVAEPV